MLRALRAREESSLVIWLGIGAAAVLLLIQQGAITHIDGRTTYEVTKSIVKHGDFSLDPNQAFGGAVPGRHGELYSKYGIGLSLVALIPYCLALPISSIGGGDIMVEAAVASIMPLICALLVVAVYGLARRLGSTVQSALLVAVGAIAGTFILAYTGEFFSEPAVALGFVVAVERALARRPGQAATALALAGLFRPQALVFAPVLVLFLIRREGWSSLRASIPPLAVATAITLLYDYARFGSLFETGYQAHDEGFSASLAGVHGLLLSVDKSIFLFVPAIAAVPFALVWLFGRQRSAALLIGMNIAITFLLGALWTAWHGDWAWGPRLLLPIVPIGLAVVAPWVDGSTVRRNVVVALFLLGFVVNVSALVASTDAQQLDAAPKGGGNRSPGIERQMELVPKAVRYSANHLGAGEAGDHRNYVDLWQVGLAREKGSKGLAAALLPTILLVGLAGFAGLAVRRRVPPLAPARVQPRQVAA